MSVAGALGGTLSSSVRPSPVSIPVPSATNPFLRAVLGGVAGLALSIVFLSSVIIPAEDSAQIRLLFAMAIGFSDEALSKMLDSLGRKTGEDVIKSVGHGARPH